MKRGREKKRVRMEVPVRGTGEECFEPLIITDQLSAPESTEWSRKR